MRTSFVFLVVANVFAAFHPGADDVAAAASAAVPVLRRRGSGEEEEGSSSSSKAEIIIIDEAGDDIDRRRRRRELPDDGGGGGSSAPGSDGGCDCAENALLAIYGTHEDALGFVPLTFLGLLEENKDVIVPPDLGYDPVSEYGALISAARDVVGFAADALKYIECGRCDVYDDDGLSGGGGGDPLQGANHYECCCDVDIIHDVTVERLRAMAEIVNLNPGAGAFTAVGLRSLIRSTKVAVGAIGRKYQPTTAAAAVGGVAPSSVVTAEYTTESPVVAVAPSSVVVASGESPTNSPVVVVVEPDDEREEEEEAPSCYTCQTKNLCNGEFAMYAACEPHEIVVCLPGETDYVMPMCSTVLCSPEGTVFDQKLQRCVFGE